MKHTFPFFLFLFVSSMVSVSAQEKAQGFENYRHGYNRDTLALQVQLDRRNFSCNCIDGCWGLRTENVVLTWQALNGLPQTGVPDMDLLNSLGGSTNVLCMYTVTSNDYTGLLEIPTDWTLRSRLPGMNFATVQERLAEKGHCSQRLLERLNPAAGWPNPPPGTSVQIPDCTQSSAYRNLYAATLRIALTRMEISVFAHNGMMLALFPCSIAREKAHRPAGELSVKNLAKDPPYLYDPQLFRPGCPEKAKLLIPPGPNNPVGAAWIGLSLPGYGMHGTPVPEKIGRAESHGCFRLANWNAVKLMHMVAPGVPVVVEE